MKNDRVTLQEGKPNSLKNKVGTSLVIHAEVGDYVSQPAGDSGDRIVSRVIFPLEKKEEAEE